MHPYVHLSSFMVKTAANVDPNVLAALQGGVVGAGAGALVQGVRKLLQSRRDEEENGSPSILKGMLVGGGLGAVGGYGLRNMLEHAADQQQQRQRDATGVGLLMDGMPQDIHPASLEGAMNGQHGLTPTMSGQLNPAMFHDRFAAPQLDNLADREMAAMPGPADMYRRQVHQDPSRFMPHPPQLPNMGTLTGYHPAVPMLAGTAPAF